MSREKCNDTMAMRAMPEGAESPKTKFSRIVLLGTAARLRRSTRGSGFRLRGACAGLILAALIATTGCHKKTKPHVALTPRIGATERGLASWYGYPYHGRRAANGEIYDMEKLTAAHRTLPFETWVEVRNVSNEKTVRVRITDRGPFVDGRIIDLSKAAARAIDLIGPGVGRVEVTIVAAPPPDELPAEAMFAVQIGAYREKERAERMREEFGREFGSARLVYRAGNPSMWRVLVGRETSMDAANELLGRVLEKTHPAFVVRLDESPSGDTDSGKR